MLINSYKILLEKYLMPLTLREKALFAFLCCERVLPAYKRFSIAEKWGDPIVFTDALDLIFQYIDGAPLPQREMNKILPQLLDNVPDLNDFPSVGASYALRASNCVCSTIDFLLKKNLDDLICVPESAMEMVDIYVAEKLDLPNIDAEASSRSAEMKTEVDKQRTDLLFLATHPELTTEVIEKLRAQQPMFKMD